MDIHTLHLIFIIEVDVDFQITTHGPHRFPKHGSYKSSVVHTNCTKG